MRNRQSLDYIAPEEMKLYLENYGKHFSKKMYEFAVSLMADHNGNKVKPCDKEYMKNLMNAFGLKVEHDCLYDGLYVLSMAKADFYGSSIEDEMHLARFVKDYVDDPDAVDGQIFNRFYSDCNIKGVPIDWEEMI